jgi:beta-glucosidase
VNHRSQRKTAKDLDFSIKIRIFAPDNYYKMKMQMNKLATLLCCLCMAASLQAQVLPYQDANLSAAQRADDLLGRLTLEEKVSLMMDTSPAIERLGIPQFQWWNEALHGIGRNGFATVFPITMGMAASWDDALLHKVFTAVSDEARVKAQQAKRSGDIKRYQSLSFWTPNINIFRDPRWGRGQETYGEDPYLTSKMGLAVVRGLQGVGYNGEDLGVSKYRKLLACAKHFAVHSGPEWNRHEFNVENLPERDLWETYLPAFKALVQEGKVAEIMCAYQRIDGQPCCSQTRYEQQILRDEWGFDGLITSDCGAIRDFLPRWHNTAKDATEASAQAVLAGTDVECGSEYKYLPMAVRRGDIKEADLDKSLRRLLIARFELGDFDSDDLNPWTKIPESIVACDAHKQLALDMARKSMVLLQNKNQTLPLSKDARIAVLGSNAIDSVMQWGNYSGFATRTVTALEGILQLAPQARFISGCGLTRNEVFESRFGELRNPLGSKGMQATYYNNTDMSGTPAATMNITAPIMLSNGGNTVFAPGVNLEKFSARLDATFIPTKDETVIFNINGDDKVRLIVNGDTIVNIWQVRNRIQGAQKEMDVKAGQHYRIQIDYVQVSDFAFLGFDIQHKVAPTHQQLLAQIGDAETVIFVGGISPKLEGEEMRVNEEGFKGGDRTSIELPKAQRETLAMLHQAGKKVIFVNCSGSAMALTPELESCDAIIQAWYSGELGGQALAEVLFGDYNPSGKLPITFYKNTDELPDFLDYTMKNRTYRYYTGEALFPFGFGLSYTQFEIGKPQYSNNKVRVSVKNTGTREGLETVQVYIRHLADKEGPQKTLRAYQQVTLKPGESKTIVIDLPRQSFEGWDAKTNTMRVVPGKYELMVGNSSADSQLKKITVTL